MHFYLDITDFNNNISDALKQAIKCALEAAKCANISRVVIIVPINSVAKEVGEFLLAFGCRGSKGTYNLIGYSTNIVINSIANYNNFKTDAVIYFALSSEEIFKIEEQHRFELEIAIKEYRDIDLWKGTWDVVNPQTMVHIKYVPDDKVMHAFDQQTNNINITHSKSFHSSDEESVKRFIRTLNEMEPKINPDEIFAYIKREKHWTLGLCKLVYEWISLLNNGRFFKGGKISKTEMKKLYANW